MEQSIFIEQNGAFPMTKEKRSDNTLLTENELLTPNEIITKKTDDIVLPNIQEKEPEDLMQKLSKINCATSLEEIYETFGLSIEDFNIIHEAVSKDIKAHPMKIFSILISYLINSVRCFYKQFLKTLRDFRFFRLP